MRLSVVVPTRDRLAKLRQCLASLAAQHGRERIAEVVVADDGSRDDTRAWLEAASRAAWPFPLRPLALPHRGPAAARNAAVAACRGDVVLFTGDDCAAAPHLLRHHLRGHAAERAPVSILGHTTWHPRLAVTPFMHYQENGGSQFAYWRIADPRDAGWNAYYTTNVSTPRQLLLAHRFDERFPDARFEDMELGWRLARAGHRIVYQPRALCWHDHPVTFEAFRRASRRYGEHAALFHRLHPDEELARAIGVRDALAARASHGPALRWAERSVAQLEPLFPRWDPPAETFGARGGLEILRASYRLLIHHALVSGIRRALGLPELPPSPEPGVAPLPRGAQESGSCDRSGWETPAGALVRGSAHS